MILPKFDRKSAAKQGKNARKYQYLIFDEKKLLKGDVKAYRMGKLEEEKPALLQDAEKGPVLSYEEIKEKDFFEVASIVGKYRNIKSQEREELEKKIYSELQGRLGEIEKAAFDKGYSEGFKQGNSDIQNKLDIEVEQQIGKVTDLVNEVLSSRTQLLSDRVRDSYKLLNNIARWIIMRELKDDGQYIQTLLQKLLLNMEAKNDVVVYVSEQKFSQLEEALESVQNNIGKLKNVRIVKKPELENDAGLIIECENGTVDGSVETQMQNIDRIFTEQIEEVDDA